MCLCFPGKTLNNDITAANRFGAPALRSMEPITTFTDSRPVSFFYIFCIRELFFQSSGKNILHSHMVLAWLWSSVASACDCVSVCVSVRTLKGKRLELATPKESVEI